MKISTKRPRMRQPEVSAYSGIAESTLEKWRVKGIGPRYSKLNRRMVVYDPDEVDRFLEERTQSSTAENPRPAPPPKRPRGRPRKQPPADLAAE
jgi:predicted DNA-binding transcriptional regulator AlpA